MNWVYSPWGITEWPSAKDAWLKETLAARTADDETGRPVTPLAPILEEYGFQGE